MNYERPNSHRFRSRLALASAVVVVTGIVVFKANNPGPLSGKHTTFARDCQSCHDTRDWIQAGFTSYDFSGKCTACHKFAGPADQAHNQMFDDRPVPHTTCVQCHREHQGATVVTTTDCNSCHKQKLTAFVVDHPQFPVRPPVTAVKFDHTAHLKQHFTDARYAKLAPPSCTVCHAGEQERVSFDKSCAACHGEQIAPNELVVWRLGDEPTKFMTLVSNDATRVFGKVPDAMLAGLNSDQLTGPATLWAEKKPFEPSGAAPKSGWYWTGDPSVEPVELHYKPTGHADNVVKAWLEFMPGKEFTDPKTGVGRCMKCHESPTNWTTIAAALPAHTVFSHPAHAGVAQCATCHGDVRPVQKDSCVQCHAPGKVRQDCQLCHRYHNTPTVAAVYDNRASEHD